MMATAIENPVTLKYTNTHEWVSEDNSNIITIGITHHAQDQLGDIVFVDLPDVGTHITAGSDIIVVESVKTAADIYAPVSGEIIEINKALHNTPEAVNESPFTDGWLCKIKIADNAALSNLLSAEQYSQQINED